MDETIDPREMRKRIAEASRRGTPVSGKAVPPGQMTVGGVLARHIMIFAEREGMSGEDTMTMLAYHALIALEQSQARLLEMAMLTPAQPLVFVKQEPA